MPLSTGQEGDANPNLSRSEAEAFKKVCDYFFEQMGEPEEGIPKTLVLELKHNESIRQVHFVVWPHQEIPSGEAGVHEEGIEHGLG